MIIILMGVSGSGKTTIGELLSEALVWKFYDADDFHPPANVEKMSRGVALNDDDRSIWLDRLSNLIGEIIGRGESAVLACSALKQAYRQQLAGGREEARFVYLKGDYELLKRRLGDRRGHYFNPDLLASQFDTLEEPEGAITVEVDDDPDTIVANIRRALGL